MILHVFNPEHDIALSYQREHLTVPHAAQELRMNLGWLPAIWAHDGDIVLVDDVPFAVKSAMHWHGPKSDVLFLSPQDLRDIHFDAISPWGWDITLCNQLMSAGIDPSLLPTPAILSSIRNLSNRRFTTKALTNVRQGLEDVTCGVSAYATTEGEVMQLLKKWKHTVVKAPWSSSGRGIRYLSLPLSPSQQGFIRNVISLQGGIMVEPYYDKVIDFGMEYSMSAQGTAEFLGLSLFHTVNGAYTSNLIAPESEKRSILQKYTPLSLIDDLCERMRCHCQEAMKDSYEGPFGVDMMIVKKEDEKGFLVHPCVEVNIRRTMGHVALNMPVTASHPKRVMAITHHVNYQLKISAIENCFVKTL